MATSALDAWTLTSGIAGPAQVRADRNAIDAAGVPFTGVAISVDADRRAVLDEAPQLLADEGPWNGPANALHGAGLLPVLPHFADGDVFAVTGDHLEELEVCLLVAPVGRENVAAFELVGGGAGVASLGLRLETRSGALEGAIDGVVPIGLLTIAEEHGRSRLPTHEDEGDVLAASIGMRIGDRVRERVDPMAWGGM